MIRNTLKVAISLAVLLGLSVTDAHAGWGPRGRETITTTSIQMIRHTFADAFRSDVINYEQDVLKGAATDPRILNPNTDFTDETVLFTTMANEIQLLRSARRYGIGSYFSYRMGVLAALVSDTMLPFGLDDAPEGEALRQRITIDIENHLIGFAFSPDSDDLIYVRNPKEYFTQNRPFFENARELIEQDYRRGSGYNGYLKEGANKFFGEAIQAVADVWYTVLRQQSDVTEMTPSAHALTWYLVDEIKYLLLVKRNAKQAEKTYAFFVNTNPGIMQAYETVGDYFYVAGARERGVQEWKIAYNATGVDRKRVAEKLSKHYLTVGDRFSERAQGEDRLETDLNDALEAYTLSLKYDGSNQDAAERITATSDAIKAREERLELMVGIIARARSVIRLGEGFEKEGNLPGAVDNYQKARALFGIVTDEFFDQFAAAERGIQEARGKIADIVEALLDQAINTITEADRLVDDQRFDEAIERYQGVETLVSAIPGNEGTTTGKRRQEMIDRAAEGVEKAIQAKQRYQQAQQAAQAGARPGGAS